VSFAYLERCFLAQSGNGDAATAFDQYSTVQYSSALGETTPHHHDPAEWLALTHGQTPNLLVWTGDQHQAVLSLKWDYEVAWLEADVLRRRRTPRTIWTLTRTARRRNGDDPTREEAEGPEGRV